jgi:putative DNA primase/helicase
MINPISDPATKASTTAHAIAAMVDAAAALAGVPGPTAGSQPPSLAQKNLPTLAAPAATTEATLLPCLVECAQFDHSDTDNGKRLRAYFGGDILVRLEKEVAGGSYLVWSGRYWDLGNGAAGAVLLAQRVGDLIMREADVMSATPRELQLIKTADAAAKQRQAFDLIPESKLDDEQNAQIRVIDEKILAGSSAREALYKRKAARRRFAVSSKNMARIAAMLATAAPHLRRDPEDFNANPYVVATQRHTLHFVQGRDLECPDPDAERLKWQVEAHDGHNRADLITALVPVEYDPEVVAPSWQKFLDRFMPLPVQQEKRRTLQQYCGIGLLGVLVQNVMYHYGLGANGKSVFLETLTRLLGSDFAVSLPPETLIGKTDRGAGQASPDIMRLFGKRMLRVPEVPADKPLQEALIKQITGGERITARSLFKGYVDFTNMAKPHMSGNGFPKIDGTDNGIWRRILVMHWTETIAPADQRNLEDVVTDLLQEAPGILNWLIDGALDFLNNGFYVAPEVRAATQDYRDEMDSIGQFARDCIERCPGESVTARTLYNAYRDWAHANAKNPVFETKFGRVMKTLYDRQDGRVRRYLDIKLHDVPAINPEDAPPFDPTEAIMPE